ncbi:MAG: 2OG-Fe(II) oxygenase [Gammaproteobacteria bacterium]|nr:2OG-Fe(II) oxygenase [Gammaproteobacteria bacterium]MDE0509013.1 2OG-Fe(II) oxygenase [Gammaproteobacteria bacterium]MXY91239.1 2OG-Fe(II) oxygenase [Gammaproteobacteria bacterium]MYA35937.1 2OG-Fe(II) oxygenase [Gammaproteobacteria bacterium]MYA67740.1 2OG-Fe(II) oxygenase [Gammaproteobacteria bacterium]
MVPFERVAALNWTRISSDLDAVGYATTCPLLGVEECEEIANLYDSSLGVFRSTIEMSRYNFGSGQYRYFSYPLPSLVEELRKSFYPPLSGIANDWAARLGLDTKWPDNHKEFVESCHRHNQRRPTPLLLSYNSGDYNCLHQDLYGEVFFPLQVVFMLSDPVTDFDGGELIVVETRPRMQSRASAINLSQGCAAIIPVRERPRKSNRGYHRVQSRHGVSTVGNGRRITLGIIFHDAL